MSDGDSVLLGACTVDDDSDIDGSDDNDREGDHGKDDDGSCNDERGDG